MGTLTAPSNEDIAIALQSALQAAIERSDDAEIDYSKGLTLNEIAEFLGITETMARKRLKRAIKQGTVVCNGRQVRRNVAGERCRSIVYTVKDSS